MLSQLLTAVRNSTTNTVRFLYGREPSSGLYAIQGENDEPFSDRLVVCVRRGRTFRAMSLKDALQSGNSIIEDSSGLALQGYRVVQRSSNALSDQSKRKWTRTCRLMSSTLDGMFQACESLGYMNLTHESLQIADGLHSNRVVNIPNALPVLIMPYWDNAETARYAIPGWDGHACIFRLNGQYEDVTSEEKRLVGVDRAARESQTVTWLGRPGGQWKNGWYEDLRGMRWYSDIIALDTEDTYGLLPRHFDLSIGREVVCKIYSVCSTRVLVDSWSDELTSTLHLAKETSVAISNGTRFGLFFYRASGVYVVTSVYDFATLISNASVLGLLFRWMFAMVAVHRGYIKRVSSWHSVGIGCLANSPSFTYLPIAMLPRLKMILAVFFTVGCAFEGQQKALGDSWFVIYPSIVDFVFIYASLLNTVSRLLRRRMSDWVFPFVIVAFSGMHFFRQVISGLSLLGLQGRMSTLVGSEEFQMLTPADMLFTDAGLRMGGRVCMLLWLKAFILLLGVVSLLLSKNMALQSQLSRTHDSCRIENALVIRACNVGGIGKSGNGYEMLRGQLTTELNSYELIRSGYLVLGDRYLMKMEDWWILSSMKEFKSFYSLWNYRVMVFELSEISTEAGGMSLFQVSSRGQLMSIYDSDLISIEWWDIDARSLL